MMHEVKLARQGLGVDPVHDGRHRLPDSPIARESIPMMINDPDAGVAGFVYTWVTGASEGGAVLALFGPGVGDAPIVEPLADRPVPEDMGFDAWQIEGFRMENDLAFDKSRLTWKSPTAEIDLLFEAFHPPYAYGAHTDGCPSYTATDRIEQSGTLRGTIEVAGRRFDYDGLGHRDHSWGTRDWGAWQHYNWFEGQCADGTSVHFWRFIALGKINLRGYVSKDGLLAEITDLDLDVTFNDELWQQSFVAKITDEAGRHTEVAGEFYAHFPLIPSDLLTLREGAARATYDGKPGIGWMEVAWPPAYLEYVQANGPY
jgi:hypothetical protein